MPHPQDAHVFEALDAEFLPVFVVMPASMFRDEPTIAGRSQVMWDRPEKHLAIVWNCSAQTC
jgi:hypothetical protein